MAARRTRQYAISPAITLPAAITDLPAQVVWLPTNSPGSTLRRSLGETEVIEVTFRRGSTRSSAAIRRRGIRQRLTYRIRVTDNSGKVFNLRVRSRPRR